MRTRIALTILFALLVGLASAQVPYHNSVAWRAQQWVPSTAKPYALKYWWNNTNLVTGSTVTHWVDQVSSVDATPYASTTPPTNATGGVFIDGYNANMGLHPANNTGGTNCALGVICGIKSKIPVNGINLIVLGGGSIDVRAPVSTINSFSVYSPDNGNNAIGDAVTLGTPYDVVVIALTNHFYCYINGEFVVDLPATLPANGMFLDHIGGDAVSYHGFVGWVSDVMIYTNVNSTNITLPADVHYYRTNSNRGTPAP